VLLTEKTVVVEPQLLERRALEGKSADVVVRLKAEDMNLVRVASLWVSESLGGSPLQKQSNLESKSNISTWHQTPLRRNSAAVPQVARLLSTSPSLARCGGRDPDKFRGAA